jgi:LysR family transcriptional regulator, low CO2-responsive transcriptional regulator
LPLKEILNIFPFVKEKLNPVLRRVTLRQLRVLAAAVRSGTVTGAAGALGVTPPAASLQLRQLEETFQVALVERGADGVRPTDAGREVLAAAERIEAALAECADAIAALRGIERGRVAVGVISTAKYFAPRALAAFKRAHPNVEMRVLVGNRRETLDALEAFELDLAVMGRPPERFEVERAVLGDNPHVIIAPPDHAAVGRRRLPLEALAGDTFLLREAGSGTRLLVERLFAEAGQAPAAGVEIGSNETIKQAVMAGMGVALLSAHTVAAEARDGRLAVLDVEGLPVVRQWYVVKRREKRLLPAARALWDHLARDGGDYLPDVSAFLPRGRPTPGHPGPGRRAAG